MRITFNTAKLAKEKGFDWVCNAHNNERDGFMFPSETIMTSYKNFNNMYLSTSIPTQEELKSWLRKEHNIDVSVIPYGEVNLHLDDAPLEKMYTSRVDNWKVRWSVHDGTGLVMPEHYHFEGSNYDDAFEQGLYKALELL